jgi:hypothetical protein
MRAWIHAGAPEALEADRRSAGRVPQERTLMPPPTDVIRDRRRELEKERARREIEER